MRHESSSHRRREKQRRRAGVEASPRHTREELRTMRTAASELWAVPDELRLEGLYLIDQIMASPKSPKYLRLAAVKAMIAMGRSDTETRRLQFLVDQAGRPPFSLADVVRDMERDAADYERSNGEYPSPDG
jgi:hypothetical protein